jgi:DNA polymerase-3 subunit delta'
VSSERPLGHDDVLAGLWRSAADGRLPHALLAHGPEGVGKFLALRWFARGLLCARGPGEPCGACAPCKRVASGNHADLFVVDARAAGQDQLTIHFVARRDQRPSEAYQGPAIEDFLELRAHEGGWRIVLMREAERLNEAAQNALLKTLEEPSPETLIAVETSRPARLLPTVRSRLVSVPFQPLCDEDVRAALAGHRLAGEDAGLLGRLSAGAPGRALTLAGRGALPMRELLREAFGAGRPAAVLRRAVLELAGEFPGKTPAAQQRAKAQAFLDLGLEVLRDQERAAAGVPLDVLPHGALVGELPLPGGALRERRMDHWLESRQDVELNLSPDGVLDRALVAARAGRGRARTPEAKP